MISFAQKSFQSSLHPIQSRYFPVKADVLKDTLLFPAFLSLFLDIDTQFTFHLCTELWEVILLSFLFLDRHYLGLKCRLLRLAFKTLSDFLPDVTWHIDSEPFWLVYLQTSSMLRVKRRTGHRSFIICCFYGLNANVLRRRAGSERVNSPEDLVLQKRGPQQHVPTCAIRRTAKICPELTGFLEWLDVSWIR